jgi:hypothetical protein
MARFRSVAMTWGCRRIMSSLIIETHDPTLAEANLPSRPHRFSIGQYGMMDAAFCRNHAQLTSLTNRPQIVTATRNRLFERGSPTGRL